MVDQGGEFSIFQSIHVRFGTRIDISISIRPMTTKADLSTGFDSNETNEAGADDVIT